jgi:hypothetical protein
VVAPEQDGAPGEEPAGRGIRSAMFYKAIGYVIWKLAVAQLRSRYGHLVTPGAAVATAVALIAVWVATRGSDE